MAIINMSSILPKLNAFVGSAAGKRMIGEAIQTATLKFGGGKSKHSPEEAAYKLIEVMDATVQSMSGTTLGETAVSAASNFVALTPVVENNNGGVVVTIPFEFQGDLHRHSLNPKLYGGIDNIVALLNNGYTAGHTVFGNWHGKNIPSRREREGAQFVQSAVAEFMSTYGDEYDVISVDIGGAFG